MKKNKGDVNLLLTIGLVNVAVLYLSSLLMPASIVLGNDSVPGLLAAIFVSILLTSFLALVPTVTKNLKLKLDSVVSLNIAYGLVNIAGLWLLAKFAHYLGFGIGSFWVAIMLGAVLTVVQYLLWTSLAKKK